MLILALIVGGIVAGSKTANMIFKPDLVCYSFVLHDLVCSDLVLLRTQRIPTIPPPAEEEQKATSRPSSTKTS